MGQNQSKYPRNEPVDKLGSPHLSEPSEEKKDLAKTNETLLELKFLKPSDLFNPLFRPDLRAQQKSHFQITFWFVASSKRRQAMRDLYTYCRLVDDIADEAGLSTEDRASLLDAVRDWLTKQQTVGHPFWDRFQQEANSLGISWTSLMGILDGVSMDLDPKFHHLQTWKDLDRYIYGVASCVGEAVLDILGVGGANSKKYSHHMGRALQLWNILRDLETDQAMGRTYVPREFLGNLALNQQLDHVRKTIYAKALAEWNCAIPYSYKCLPAEMMGLIYKQGATKYWQYGSPKRLSRFEKILCIFRAVVSFSQRSSIK